MCTTELDEVARLKPEWVKRNVRMIGLSVDPAKEVRLIMTYPPNAGRNFQAILRAVYSLQLTDKEKVSTPGQLGGPGKPVIIAPSLAGADAKIRFPRGWKTLKLISGWSIYPERLTKPQNSARIGRIETVSRWAVIKASLICNNGVATSP